MNLIHLEKYIRYAKHLVWPDVVQYKIVAKIAIHNNIVSVILCEGNFFP